MTTLKSAFLSSILLFGAADVYAMESEYDTAKIDFISSPVILSDAESEDRLDGPLEPLSPPNERASPPVSSKTEPGAITFNEETNLFEGDAVDEMDSLAGQLAAYYCGIFQQVDNELLEQTS